MPGLSGLLRLASKAKSLASKEAAKKALKVSGDAFMFLSVVLAPIADAISRLNAQRGTFNKALSDAKKRCRLKYQYYTEEQKCIREAMIDFATKMASSYRQEVMYYKSALPRATDEKIKEKIQKAIEKTEKKYEYYNKLASLLKSTDIPITAAADEAKKE